MHAYIDQQNIYNIAKSQKYNIVIIIQKTIPVLYCIVLQNIPTSSQQHTHIMPTTNTQRYTISNTHHPSSTSILSKLTILINHLILIMIFTMPQHVYAHTYTCQFNRLYKQHRRSVHNVLDKHDQLLPDYQHYEGNGYKRRNLQAVVRNTIRITLDTNDFNSIKTTTNGEAQTTATKLAFIRKAMLITETFYQAKLKVSTVARVFAPATCIDFNPSSNDVSNGISASDLHIYVRYVTNKNIGYGATGVSCKWITTRSLPDSTYQQGRPVVGRIIFNTYNLVDRQTSLTNLLFAEVATTALHETLHILGFDSSMYGTYLDSGTANIYSYSVTQSVLLDSGRTGGNNYILKTPKVTAWAQQFFGCATITGMALENEETTPGIGSHWERLAMYDQLMTGTQLGARKGFSGLSFAILKDMGWYQVDDAFNDTSNYGYHLDCGFYNKACYDTTTYPKYFCDTTAYNGVFACATNFLGKAICTDQSGAMTDGCGILAGYFNCVDPAQSDDGYKSYTLQKYRTDSFCIQSTFANVGITDKYRGRCYPYKCLTSSIQFYIDIYTITCLSGEEGVQKTINSLNGYLQCPNFIDFCQESRKICQNWCSQNGYCIRGICVCLPGYYGKDCSNTTCTTGQYYDETTSTCVTSCPSGTYVNLYSRACLVCDPACNQCRDEPTICTGCLSTPSNPQFFVVSLSRCESTCPPTTYTDGDYCRDCDSGAAVSCATCSYASTNCTSCLNGKFLQNPYWGSCVTSCSGTYSIYDVVNYKCVSTCTDNLVYNAGGCTVCPSSTDGNCDMCPANSYKYIGDQLCHANCPSTYYENIARRFCQKCHTTCKQCDGGFAQNCTQCLSSSTNKYLLLSRMCVSSCPLGFYANDASGVCQLCDPNLFCDTCQRLSNGTILCLTCKYGYYLQTNQTCTSSCQPLYYKNAWGRTCQPCSADCGNCTANSSSSCIDCPSGKVYLGNISGKYCLSACPAYYYYRSGSNCLDCYSTCKTCGGTASNNCLTCVQGLYLSSGMCRYVCPGRTYPRDSTSRCQSCDNSCTFCFGPTVDNCTACASGLVLNNFTCTTSCPKGLTVNQWGVCYEVFASFKQIAILFFAVLVIMGV